jgi:prepilin-type N-terminal cleavage/methylation domain-containing protein
MSARHSGFTLIELIVALTISALVVGFVVTFINVPVQAHLAQARRSELAASAESVTHWMSQDVRGALPNSIRTGMVNGRAAVEMIDVATVTIYGDTLDFTAPDSQFDVLGLPAAAASHVVVNNLGTAGHDAYNSALTDVIAPANVNTASATITLNPAFQFGSVSPHRRAFLVSAAGAVTRYECDAAARTLRRYDGLPTAAAMAALPAGTPSRLIARDVAGCTFTPRPPAVDQALVPLDGGMLLIQVTISRATNGATETLRVVKQLKVEEAA